MVDKKQGDYFCNDGQPKMKHSPSRFTKLWIATRREFMGRIGWTSVELTDTEFVAEYRAMLIALKKECTGNGMAYVLGSTAQTLINDRKMMGIIARKRGGSNVPIRLFSHKNKLMSCQQVAASEGCSYNAAYARLTKGVWA